MSYSDRFTKYALGDISIVKGDKNGLISLNSTNPHSSDFSPDIGNSVEDITYFLIGFQRRLYGKTILETVESIHIGILKRHIKSALKHYTPLEIKRGIFLAAERSNYPFSVSFIKSQIAEK